MWDDLWVALALVLVIEGLLPFMSPRGYRHMVENLAQMDDRALRMTGLVIMLLGVFCVYLLKN